jgi:hypothetical protein
MASNQCPDSSCPARQYFNYLTAENASAVLLLGEIWVSFDHAITRNSVLTLVSATRFVAKADGR